VLIEEWRLTSAYNYDESRATVERTRFDLQFPTVQQRQKPIHLPAYRLKSLNERGTLQFEPTSSLVCTHALKSPDHVTAVAVFSSRRWSSWAAAARRPAGITLGARALLISCLLASSIDDSARRRLERSLSFPPVRPNINFPAKMFFFADGQRTVGLCEPARWSRLPSALRDNSLSLNTLKQKLRTLIFGQRQSCRE